MTDSKKIRNHQKVLSPDPASRPERATRTTVDTILFTADDARSWPLPTFQRPLRVNDKVAALSLQIKADKGVIPGILTFGAVGDNRYLLDGQHRREAFLRSGCEIGYADVRYCHFEHESAMGAEFVRLWGALNMTLCMWLYRRCVLNLGRTKDARSTRISAQHFRAALMGLSANEGYLDWLVGRNLGDKNRSPGLNRIKLILSKRLEHAGMQKVLLPAPPWAAGPRMTKRQISDARQATGA